MKKLMLVAFAMAFGFAHAADALMTKYNGITRCVAKDGDDDKYDGRSLTPTEESGVGGKMKGPFKTIQKAMGVSSSSDRVLVGPGEYTYEEAADDTSGIGNKAVVRVKGGVLLESSEGKDKTFIVGKWSEDAEAINGVGAGAVRCVYLMAAGACVKGFTLRNGATVSSAQVNNKDCCGAGVVGAQLGSNDSTGIPSGTPTYAVDCIIENCRSGHGAAAGQGVMLINCLMRGNVGVGGNHWHCTYRVYNQYNCIFEGNGEYNGCCVGGGTLNHLSNCTFLFNKCDPIYGGAAAGERLHMYNCAFIGNYNQETSKSYCVLTNNVSSGNSKTGGTVTMNPTTKNGVSLVQQYSTVAGDYRLVGGSDLIDAGSDEGFAEMSTNWIPSDFADKDFLGNPRKVGEHIDAGAVEAQGDEPALGYSQMVLMDGVRVQIGEKTYESTYGGQTLAFDEFPGQVRVTYMGAGDLFAYDFCGNGMKGWIGGTFAGLRYPDRTDDLGVWVTPFQKTDEMLILNAYAAAKTLWVDGSYAGGDSDGTEEKPYTTIQAAIDSVTTSDRTVINVKKGTYTASATAVVKVTVTRNFSIRSVDGPEETIIKGGEGVNCVYVDNKGYKVGLSGFTFTGANYSGTGGALRLPANGYASANTGCSYDSANVQVLDSIISNNYAACAGGIVGGWAQRCLFVNNSASTGNNGNRGSAAKYAILSSCVFCDNAPGQLEEVCFSVAHNCTFHSKSSTGINMWGQPCTVYNCVEFEGNSAGVDPNYVKCVGNVLVQLAAGGSGFGTTYASWKDVFVNKDLNDLRFRSDSAALLDGSDEAVKPCYFAVGDYQGNALAFPNDEKPLAPIPGAFQQTVSVANATINDPDGATGFTESAQTFAVGEEVVISAEKSGRHVKSVTVSVNGGAATPLDEGVYSYAWTPESATDTLVLTVEGDPNWYVDAENGDDANNGFTPATAKKTLRGIMTVPALRSGDTVHAAPGTYDQGVMTNDVNYIVSGETPHPSRVVVPAGVALVADEGKEKTFILGEYHSGSTRWGANAVRGVYLYPGARVEGFTIKRASANSGAGGKHEYSSGGCVGAPPYNAANPAIIRNCTLTGGGGRNAGGVSGGLVDHCFISDCGVGSDGSCAINSRIENSVLFGGGQAAVENHYGICNSVIYSTGTGNDPDMNAADANAEVVNSVIFVGTAGNSTAQTVIKNMRNCIFKADNGNATKRRAVVDDATCSNVITNNDITKIINTTTGALIPGSPAIDAGDNAFLDNLKGDKTLDLVGHPRVCNDTVDIGAYEMMHWYVDATNGDDENNGFSPETAKKTLAAVMANVTSGETVHALPGTYDQGVMTNTVLQYGTRGAIPSRVVVPAGVTLVSTGGKDVTIIKGAWHSSDSRCGDNAIRCVYLYANTRLEGFTLTDGAVKTNLGNYWDDNTGGCVLAPAGNRADTAYIVDCTMVRGGGKGAASMGGFLDRCVITDCAHVSDGITWGSKLRNCLIAGKISGSIFRSCYGADSCTVDASYPNKATDPEFNMASGCYIQNSILYYSSFGLAYGGRVVTASNIRNSLVIASEGNLVYDASCSNNITNNDRSAIFAATGSQRLFSESVAFNAGSNELLATYDDGKGDLEGKDRVVDGIVDLGCYEYVPRPKAHVSAVGGGVEPSGDFEVALGDSKTIHASDADRNVSSFTVLTNGAPVVLPAGTREYTWTPTGMKDTLSVEVIYSTDWYVDANADNDSGNGWTPETAKKTLVGIMTAPGLRAGDTVHAAAGTYDEGEMTNTIHHINAEAVIGSRVVVPEGVALIGAGIGQSIIKGRWKTGATPSTEIAEAAGDGALRGVYLHKGCLLEGFTITDAATKGGASTPREYCAGGCVVAPKATSLADTAIVRYCELTRGSGRNAGGIWGGLLDHCYIHDCEVASDGACSMYSRIENSLLLKSRGQTTVEYYYGIYNSTISSAGTGSDPDFNAAVAGAKIVNSIVIFGNRAVGTPEAVKNMHNCVFTAGDNTWRKYVDDATCSNIITNNDIAKVVSIADGYRPFAGSAVIDAGDNSYLDEMWSTDETAYDRGQRIYNGTVDIGCNEYNWCPDYAKDLKHAKITVTNATPNVVEVEGGVMIPGGESLALVWPGKGRPYTVNFEITGAGTLTVTDEKGEQSTYTAGQTSFTIQAPTADTALSFAFDGEGSATLKPFKGSAGFSFFIR